MISQNLERLCAEYGYDIAEKMRQTLGKPSDAENHITRSLGVLQEDGVYAFFLYQASRKKGGTELTKRVHELLSAVDIAPFGSVADSLSAVRGDNVKGIPGLADDLDQILLAKRLLERTLIYGRFHAKALGE